MVTTARIFGDQVGSAAPVFLAFLAVHVLAGLTAVVAGAAAALIRKGSHRHIRAGRLFYRAITVVFATATALAVMRWRQDYHLLIIGAVAFAAATIGYLHRKRHRPGDTGHRDGHRLRGDADRLLCRQRPAPAPVGPTATTDVLVPARRDRGSYHCSRRAFRAPPSPACRGRGPGSFASRLAIARRSCRRGCASAR